MGLVPAASPFAHKTSIELQELGKLSRTPSGMGMNGQDNACASGHGLRRPVRLDKLEEWLDLGRSKLKGMQRKLMTHVIPPASGGETFTSHEALLRGREVIYSLYNTSVHALSSRKLRVLPCLSSRGWNEFTVACTSGSTGIGSILA